MASASIPRWLLIHGLFLFAVGAGGYIWNPAKAISALIVGVICGGTNLFLALRTSGGAAWSPKAALWLNVLFVMLFGWRASGAWSGYSKGNDDKLVPAVLITLMFASAALITLPLRAHKPLATKVNTKRK